jgi:hypothetical protein
LNRFLPALEIPFIHAKIAVLEVLLDAQRTHLTSTIVQALGSDLPALQYPTLVDSQSITATLVQIEGNNLLLQSAGLPRKHCVDRVTTACLIHSITILP